MATKGAPPAASTSEYPKGTAGTADGLAPARRQSRSTGRLTPSIGRQGPHGQTMHVSSRISTTRRAGARPDRRAPPRALGCPAPGTNSECARLTSIAETPAGIPAARQMGGCWCKGSRRTRAPPARDLPGREDASDVPAAGRSRTCGCTRGPVERRAPEASDGLRRAGPRRTRACHLANSTVIGDAWAAGAAPAGALRPSSRRRRGSAWCSRGEHRRGAGDRGAIPGRPPTR